MFYWVINIYEQNKICYVQDHVRVVDRSFEEKILRSEALNKLSRNQLYFEKVKNFQEDLTIVR